MALLIVGTTVGLSYWRFHSPYSAFRVLAGQRHSLEKTTYRLQEPPKEEGSSLNLRASNLSSSPMTLYGLSTFCGLDGCINTEEQFPLDVAPLSCRNVVFCVRPPKGARLFSRVTTELYTSRGTFEIVVVRESAGDER